MPVSPRPPSSTLLPPYQPHLLSVTLICNHKRTFDWVKHNVTPNTQAHRVCWDAEPKMKSGNHDPSYKAAKPGVLILSNKLLEGLVGW